MSAVSEIVVELKGRGVQFELRPGGAVRLFPSRLIDPPLLDHINIHKNELIARIRADLAEAEIDRLARADGWTPLPSAGALTSSIVSTFQRGDVLHRMDAAAGDLKRHKADTKADELNQPSKPLSIDGYMNDLVTLVTAGWTPGTARNRCINDKGRG